jgi:hypothetical protein
MYFSIDLQWLVRMRVGEEIDGDVLVANPATFSANELRHRFGRRRCREKRDGFGTAWGSLKPERRRQG